MDLNTITDLFKKLKPGAGMNRAQRRTNEKEARREWIKLPLARNRQNKKIQRAAHRQEKARERTRMRKHAADAKLNGIAALPPGGFFASVSKK